MYLKSLTLKNFRNYSRINIAFNKKNNLLIGENGLGKTNILESIYLLALMKSFRSVLDKDLIKHGADSYFIKGVFEENDSESFISIGVQQDKKQVFLNQTKVKKISSLIGTLKVVVFTQPDIQLIIGAPSIRRKYLDITLSLAYKSYFEHLQKYQKILKQRNTALKRVTREKSSKESVSIWNDQLIETGSTIINMRKEFFDPINEMTQSLYNSLSFEINNFHLSYRSSIGNISDGSHIKDLFKKKLLENREREVQYKQTLFGPHKDDFLIKSDNVEFKRFASQGQNRAGALTLKLAMTKYIESISHSKTILLLDDVLLDLDEKKKGKFLELVDGRQNIFTATSLHGLEQIKEESSIYSVAGTGLSEIKITG